MFSILFLPLPIYPISPLNSHPIVTDSHTIPCIRKANRDPLGTKFPSPTLIIFVLKKGEIQNTKLQCSAGAASKRPSSRPPAIPPALAFSLRRSAYCNISRSQQEGSFLICRRQSGQAVRFRLFLDSGPAERPNVRVSGFFPRTPCMPCPLRVCIVGIGCKMQVAFRVRRLAGHCFEPIV